MPVSAWSQELLQLLALGQAAVFGLRVLRELGIPAGSGFLWLAGLILAALCQLCHSSAHQSGDELRPLCWESEVDQADATLSPV